MYNVIFILFSYTTKTSLPNPLLATFNFLSGSFSMNYPRCCQTYMNIFINHHSWWLFSSSRLSWPGSRRLVFLGSNYNGSKRNFIFYWNFPKFLHLFFSYNPSPCFSQPILGVIEDYVSHGVVLYTKVCGFVNFYLCPIYCCTTL